MKERFTARLILLDSENRLLLMKVNDPSVADPASPIKGDFWCTIGGKMEAGESVLQAAAREAREEVGLEVDNITIGSVIWHGEQVLTWKGEPTLLKESFVLARANKTSVSEEGRTADERAVIKETRWWTLEELASSDQRIFPPILPCLLPAIVRGEIPDDPMTIDLSSDRMSLPNLSNGTEKPRNPGLKP